MTPDEAKAAVQVPDALKLERVRKSHNYTTMVGVKFRGKTNVMIEMNMILFND
jgi:hypothetical protein